MDVRELYKYFLTNALVKINKRKMAKFKTAFSEVLPKLRAQSDHGYRL